MPLSLFPLITNKYALTHPKVKKEIARRCRCLVPAAWRSSREDVQQPTGPTARPPLLNSTLTVFFKSKKSIKITIDDNSSDSNHSAESNDDLTDALVPSDISSEPTIAFYQASTPLDSASHPSNSRSSQRTKIHKKIRGKPGNKHITGTE